MIFSQKYHYGKEYQKKFERDAKKIMNNQLLNSLLKS